MRIGDLLNDGSFARKTELKLTPARELGLVDDPDTALDPLPGVRGYDVAQSCSECEANEATVACLRAEVARLRDEARELRRAALPMGRAADDLGLRAAVLDAEERGVGE